MAGPARSCQKPGASTPIKALAAREQRSKPQGFNASGPSTGGFTLIEMLLAISLSLVVMGAAFGYFSSVENMTKTTSLISDANDNLRGAARLMRQDLSGAGTGIPPETGVSNRAGVPVVAIPLPSGNGSTAVKRPGPGNTTFAGNTLPVITPGYQMSGTINGQTSDEVTIVKVDDQWMSNTNPNQMWNGQTQTWSLNTLSVGSGGVTSGASGYTVSATFPSSCTPCSAISSGDLMLFTATAKGPQPPQGQQLYSLGMVTNPAPVFSTSNGVTTVTLAFGSDPLGLNQYCGNSSPCPNTIDWVNQNATFPPGITIAKIDMITYYVDNSNANHPYTLMRMLGSNVSTSNAVAYGISNLSLTYNVLTQSPPPPVTLGVSSPVCPSDCENILTVNLTLSATYRLQNGQYSGNTIVSRVTPLNLVDGNMYQ